MSSDENILTSKPELLYRFPWLSFTKVKFKEIGKKNPYEFIELLYETYTNREKIDLDKKILSIFKDAFNNLEIIQDFSFKDKELNIYIYWMLKILLLLLDNPIILNRIANLYSKNTKRLLEEYLDENMVDLYWICRDLGYNVQYYETPINISNIEKTNLGISFIDFVKLGENLRDDKRKLVNNALSHGYVYITKKNLIRLLQEHVRNEFMEIKKKSEDVHKEENRKTLEQNLLKIPRFKEIFNKIKDLMVAQKVDVINDFSEIINYKEGEEIIKFFPPCITAINAKIQENQNLKHDERLFLVFFLNALKYPIDQIIEIFKKLPDFDEKIARYQVEFAFKKGYIPHGCDKLETLGMCYKDHKTFGDKICQDGYFSKKKGEHVKINHPLTFIWIKKYRINRNLKNKGS